MPPDLFKVLRVSPTYLPGIYAWALTSHPSAAWFSALVTVSLEVWLDLEAREFYVVHILCSSGIVVSS